MLKKILKKLKLHNEKQETELEKKTKELEKILKQHAIAKKKEINFKAKDKEAELKKLDNIEEELRELGAHKLMDEIDQLYLNEIKLAGELITDDEEDIKDT